MDPSSYKQLPRSGSSSNKIRQIVRLQQLLKKWKKIAAASPSSIHLQRSTTTTSTSNGINKFLKKTLSFSDRLDNNIDAAAVPKGCLAVSVGEEEKRFVIPMDYLAHQSFQVLLREAEEEFGFQQQGILKIPCQVSLFEHILKTIQSPHHPSNSNNKTQQQPLSPSSTDDDNNNNNNIIHNVGCCSPDNHQNIIMPPQLCS